MAIREVSEVSEVSYVLRRDPGTGADELIARTTVPDGVPEELMERVIAATHRAAPAAGAALSYTRLPHRDGGGLLCSARPDAAGLRVDARYATGDPGTAWPRWPVDAWSPDRYWDEAALVGFAGEQGGRVAPFLADVRGLFADPAGRQIVLAEAEQETVAWWIALACASLPAAYARSLTFTTGTADPFGAPQQILGIGPDPDGNQDGGASGSGSAVFDRNDPLIRTHLFRVHDGLGGPGSPPGDDAWAEMTAWLWREGLPPQDAFAGNTAPDDAADAADAFALLPLVRRAVLADQWREPGGLTDGVLRELGDAATRAAEQGRLDEDTVEALTVLCRRLGSDRPSGVQPLTTALIRHRSRTSGPGDAGPARDVGVREADHPHADQPYADHPHADQPYAERPRADQPDPQYPAAELRSLLRYPFSAWERPLRSLLATARGERHPVLDEAVEKLARGLSRQDAQQERAEAVTLLDALDHPAFTRRVLEHLAREPIEGHLLALRDLAASHGDWLRAQLDGAPQAVRLAVSAARLGHGYRLVGGDLWVQLAKLHLDPEQPDAVETLKLLMRLAWPTSGQPPRNEQSRVVEACPARLVVEAGVEGRLTPWLKQPLKIDTALVDFARVAAGSPKLTPSERAVARLIVLTRDFSKGQEPVSRVVPQLAGLEEDAGRLSGTLRTAVEFWVASGIARSDPADLYDSGALRYLATGSPHVLRYYREAVDAARREGGPLAPSALSEPVRLAELFVAWSTRVEGATGRWRRMSEDLLREVLAPQLPLPGEPDFAEMARVLAHRYGEPWAQAWSEWRHGLLR